MLTELLTVIAIIGILASLLFPAFARVAEIFMDGKPLKGLPCNQKKIKLRGMGMGNEMAVLISNYEGLAPGTKVTVEASAKARTPVWDLHSGRKVGATDGKGSFTVALDNIPAHMYYLGSKYHKAVQRR